MTKRRRDGGWAFECDGCGRMASYSRDEQQALDEARGLSQRHGWEWRGFKRWQQRQLYCPDCQ